ncbi:GSCFA domain-containing protein [Sediminitomix flava]|uniref:GSCFA family protein n=1 Tax=Sediminitomix flava TaxID=379075 RepID=A0A315Z780_SEDFL|nr:GSCFA domain-containing protein [Sediminitomix flava]PWJ40004.1 GSCFA family protein [Sediminitomix flava]
MARVFRTTFEINPSDKKISFDTPILLIGSCFSEHIGNLLAYHKFSIHQNPFGILYNPSSIKQCLSRCASEKLIEEKDLFQNQGVWRHFDFHSSLSFSSQKETLEKMNKEIKKIHRNLTHYKKVIITLGTAFVYKKKNSSQIVGNCHKIPNKEFDRELLSYEACLNDLKEIRSLFPSSTEFIFTVSPVRHIRDGLELNSVSKSTLRLACHQMTQEFDNCSYFPSYELLLDDLRDYRFFESDMVHPSKESIDYIWEHFQQTYFDNKAKEMLKVVEKLKRAAEHRPFNPNTDEYRNFAEKTIQKMEGLEKLDFQDEIAHLKNQIS